MREAPANPLLEALRQAIGFEPIGDPVGNATVGRGNFRGSAVHAALIESRTASGSIGDAEATRLGALLRIVARERTPLVLFIDSAGAKVSEGLKALGAFRHLYREGLAAALGGAPIAALLGRNCYGGASMLAHLAGARLFGATTQLAMSGPSIVAASAGMNVLDEAFRAMAEASMSAASRSKASAANRVWEAGADLGDWLAEALSVREAAIDRYRRSHEEQGARLAKAPGSEPGEVVRRRDTDKLYPGGCELRESAGLIEGSGRS